MAYAQDWFKLRLPSWSNLPNARRKCARCKVQVCKCARRTVARVEDRGNALRATATVRKKHTGVFERQDLQEARSVACQNEPRVNRGEHKCSVLKVPNAHGQERNDDLAHQTLPELGEGAACVLVLFVCMCAAHRVAVRRLLQNYNIA